MKVSRNANDNGYKPESEVNVFSNDAIVKVKWVNTHGYEVMTAMQLGLKDPATIIMRYSPLINDVLIVYRDNDPKPYEIVDIDDVEEKHVWLEIKVQRIVPAR